MVSRCFENNEDGIWNRPPLLFHLLNFLLRWKFVASICSFQQENSNKDSFLVNLISFHTMNCFLFCARAQFSFCWFLFVFQIDKSQWTKNFYYANWLSKLHNSIFDSVKCSSNTDFETFYFDSFNTQKQSVIIRIQYGHINYHDYDLNWFFVELNWTAIMQ